MDSSGFDVKYHDEEKLGTEAGIHSSEIERPSTPPPYSFANKGRLNGYTCIPYSELEPLDQMIFDIEVERLSQPATASEADEDDDEDEFLRRLGFNPDGDMEPLDKAILYLEADQISNLAMNKTDEDAVSAEFYRRQWLTKEDRNIHHYNWFGTAVYGPSSTPPEISLAIIMSKPKVTNSDLNLRIHTVLHQAYLYLDPVLIDFNTPDSSAFIIQLQRRYNLDDTMKGHVVKYYTPHGLWMSEPVSANGRTEVDDGNIANYIMNYGVGNGFISQSYITSWKQFKVNHNKVRATERKPARARRNKTGLPRLSPLRQVMTAEPEDAPSLSSGNVSMLANRHSWPSSTAHRRWVMRNSRLARADVDSLEAADPNSYYSLPFPEPVRRGLGVKGTLRKASKSALAYLICGAR
jgi:hypothetical protein